MIFYDYIPKSWKIMKNHEKSWKIMENHGKS